MTKRRTRMPLQWVLLTIISIGSGAIMHSDTPARAAEPAAPPKAGLKIALQAQPFDLRDVRLLDGPFRHAQELDRHYLLSLDPDRLLHAFRLNAGLPSSAKPLGGWEAPDSEVRGHFVGHYLSACARMVAVTGDETLKKNALKVVAGMAECQKKLGNGYLSAFPETFIDRVEARQRVWAPWYTLHKIFAGLQDVYVYFGDREALEMARKFADWAERRADKLTDARMQGMLENEHGGMNETLANLAGLTGEPKYLALAERFNHHAVLDSLAEEQDKLTGLHANTQIPKAIGAAREYELTGDPKLKTTASFFWEVVTKERSYVIGGHSDGEHFSPKERLSEYLSPDTTETCNTYNMLKLTTHLFTWEPKAEYADYYERALYNHILASQNPETGMMCYYVPLRSGAHKVYNTPMDSFWCCTGTGIENHARYGDAIYFHTGKQRLYVNLFIASELKWKDQGVTLEQETQFPDKPSTRLTLHCAHPATFEIDVRHPYWAKEGFALRVNGEPVADTSAPGSYATVRREWKDGDVIEIALPMTLRTEGFKDNPHRLAFLYGPIVLSAGLEEAVNPPAIVAEDAHLPDLLTPASGKPLNFAGSASGFRVAGESSGKTLNFIPFYAMHDRNYAVYWDVFNAEQWKDKEAAYHAEQERQRDIAARTVDVVHPNEEQSERDHGYQGERSYGGDFGHKKWRDARDAGWFSYTLKVLPETPQDLICTYWGSDFGREFEILVDGVRLTTQKLNNNKPDHFFDEITALPEEMLKGKSTITIRFQAPARGMAGGVFECRVLKRDPGKEAK